MNPGDTSAGSSRHQFPQGAPNLDVPCPACGAAESRLEMTVPDFMLNLEGAFHVSRCAGCGLLFQNPRIAPQRLGRHYPDEYAPYAAREMRPGGDALRFLKDRRGYGHLDARGFRDPLRRLWGRYVADTWLLPRFVPGGRLLEIACASGMRLSLLRRLGWTDCSGIEFSEASAARARERGFPVRTGRVEDILVEIPDGSLDVVIAGFVMEHLEDPFAVAGQIAAKLRPGGQFLFSTLSLGAPDFRLYGKYWYNFDLPRHMVLFRKRDIHVMLEKNFRVERIAPIAASNDYVGSARYRARYESRWLDRLLLKAGNRIYPLCLALAGLGLSSRVAVRCRKS